MPEHLWGVLSYQTLDGHPRTSQRSIGQDVEPLCHSLVHIGCNVSSICVLGHFDQCETTSRSRSCSGFVFLILLLFAFLAVPNVALLLLVVWLKIRIFVPFILYGNNLLCLFSTIFVNGALFFAAIFAFGNNYKYKINIIINIIKINIIKIILYFNLHFCTFFENYFGKVETLKFQHLFFY